MTNGITAEVIGQLQAAVGAFKKSPIYGQIVQPRDQVLAQFRPIFSSDHVNAISADEFKSFLLLEKQPSLVGASPPGYANVLRFDEIAPTLL